MSMVCTDISKLKDETLINRFEDKYEFDFSEALKKFFMDNNGGIPKNNSFEAKGKEYELRCFLSFNDDEYNSIRKPLESFQEETHGKIAPIAKDSADNYYCVNVETGKIYFWDHDENLYYCIAESFEEFEELFD